MAKIRVQDIAKKMGVPEQDLLFKLKSIGVRVEGEESLIDSDVIGALLQGRTLPQGPQREVIMRDKGAPPPPQRRQRRPSPPPPTGGPRPPRRRQVVQKTDAKIRAIPTTARRPRKPTPEEIAAREMAEKEKAAAAAAAEERALEERKKKATGADEDAAEAVSERKDSPADDEKAVAAERETAADSAEEQEAVATAPGEVPEHPPGSPQDDIVTIAEGLRVRDLAEKLDMKAKDLMKTLFQRGIMASVNHVLEPELARQIAEDLGFEAMVVSFEEEVQLQHEIETESDGANRTTRPPVVTVMGHVDHGKTSLLDAIRKSKVAEGEHGGITQHIAAYRADLGEGKQVVFLDTPGHEAFTQLRARGARVTDIVVLVVAADDGVMPQTIEAIQHARAAKVPILVAMNKMDRPNANPDKVKKELSEQELLVEDWGGDVVCVPMSAIKGEGIDELLEMIYLTAEMRELTADPTLPGQGVVLEARKELGRGIVATVLIQSGTAEVGETFVAGATWGRIRAMTDDRGNKLDSAGPSTPVEVSGFNELPNAGDPIQIVAKESQARDIAELRREELRQRELAPAAGRMSLESLFSKIQEGEVKELPVIVKADVQGSVEVLKDALAKLSTDKVKVRVIGANAGAISTNDVLFASASDAIVVGFNVRPERNASDLAAKEQVEIRTYTVIYELIDEIKQAMTGLLEPTFREVEQGRAEVRETFKVPKVGVVAGCHVIEGVIQRGSSVRLLRDNVVVFEGGIASLRRFKDDAAEVRSGFDCGIGLAGYQDVKPGDVIEAFKQETVAPTL
ncbi:MAG: translation initiation factor IF-2 [Acidobacteria bacterium]|nr:MAG: translation initiation factor IF-2 [Acidobacteriota bacterium]